MGQPAARMGDLTAHGGTLALGNPTVLIGGAPAATMGDMHVCPMCSPGPHVGGPIAAGAPTVLIGGKPAARMGDTCVCAAPAPDVIAMGCPTVLIGGGGGGASPGGAAAAASGANAAASAAGLAPAATARPLEPWLGVAYTDAAGRPVTRWDYRASGGGAQREGQVGSGGQVWLDALAEGGDVELGLIGAYACRWSCDEALVDEPVEMSAQCVGVEDGARATFEVWREAALVDGSVKRERVWSVPGDVAGGRVTAREPFRLTWDAPEADAQGEALPSPEGGPPIPEPDPVGTSGPRPHGLEMDERTVTYRTEVVIAHLYRATSEALRFSDTIRVEVRRSDGSPARDLALRIRLKNGEVRTLWTDASGAAEIDRAEAGSYHIESIGPDQA